MSLRWWQVGLIACLAVACLSPLASSSPDGLERVAEEEGFLDHAQEGPYTILPDYMFPGVGIDSLSTILAGLAGILIVFTCSAIRKAKARNAS